MNIDPDGRIAFIPILIGVGIGALIGAIAGWRYAKYFNIPKSKMWKYILGGALI